MNAADQYSPFLSNIYRNIFSTDQFVIFNIKEIFLMRNIW